MQRADYGGGFETSLANSFACICAHALASLHIVNSCVFVQKGCVPGALYRTAMNIHGKSITSAPLLRGLFRDGAIANDISRHRSATHNSQCGHWSRALLQCRSIGVYNITEVINNKQRN